MRCSLRWATVVLAVGVLGVGRDLRAGEPHPAQKPPVSSSFRLEDGWKPLCNGRDLAGWKFRNPDAKKVWVVCDQVRLDEKDPARLVPTGKGGSPDSVMLCGGDGRGSDVMTAESFGDYQLHIEFTVPKGSNSGVYNRGLFEIQVFDSFGKPKLGFHDCGSLYERAYPRENLSRPPGEWQTYDITLKDKKIALVWNGKIVYEDHDVRYGETDREAFERLNHENAVKPAALRVKLREEDGKYVGYFGEGGTRSGLDGPDRPGPILLQGDHGPVAYRRIFIRPLLGSGRK
ncbi:MAG: DUF1080 domain-containing protein [Isosphaeraceae bacterium]